MSKDRIIEFLTKMNNQDNRCTAFPFYYQIRDWKKQLRPDGLGSDVEYYSSDLECTFYSEDEIEEYYKDHYFSDDCDGLDKEDIDFEDMLYDWKNNKNIVEYSYELEEDFKGLFLTEEDAKDHLRRNHYHYHKDADTYVKHAWRAPELEGFFKSLMEHFEIEGDNVSK